MAAFANLEGGTLFSGVAQDKDTGGPSTVVGVDGMENALAERVEQIASPSSRSGTSGAVRWTGTLPWLCTRLAVQPRAVASLRALQRFSPRGGGSIFPPRLATKSHRRRCSRSRGCHAPEGAAQRGA